MVGYWELKPPPELRGSVECLWVRVVPSDGAPAARILPDACSDLIWRSGEGAFIAGPDTSAWLSTSPPGTVLVGARFLPAVGGPALGLPLSELRNMRVDLAELLPKLDERLQPDLDPGTALRRAAQSATELVGSGSPDLAMRAAVRRLRDPRARVETLADELGLSQRQLRRRFHAAVGYGPKTLQRVLRFRRFLTEAGTTADPELAQLAFDAGYADQAHLTREAVRLGGLTPSRLLGG